jgi:hypothetical protein
LRVLQRFPRLPKIEGGEMAKMAHERTLWNLSIEEIVKMQYQFVYAIDRFLDFFGVTDPKQKDGIRAAVIQFTYSEIDKSKSLKGNPLKDTEKT